MNRLRFFVMALACALATAAVDADPPEGYHGTFSLGGASAPPGGEARLPFFINSNPGTDGFAFSIDFDEEVLEAGPNMEHVFQSPGGTEWGFAVYYPDNQNAAPGNAGVDEGFMLGAVIFSFTEPVALPVDTDAEVAAFTMRVRPDAPIGPTEIRFLDGARHPESENPTQNYLDLLNHGVLPDTRITPVLVQSRFQIVPDISIFVRGDSNDDKTVDIADARATLNYLFQAADPLPCLDAADANDDGKLNVSDAITTLQFLFLGGRPLPAPSGIQGDDPTPDSLDCAR